MNIEENALQKPKIDRTAEELTPFTVESLRRKKNLEDKIFREKGKFDDEEVDKYLMKMLEKRKGYLYSRL